ncbi:hypothetical protein GCM10020000_76780 [Streptomyces olivoverticillatus]
MPIASTAMRVMLTKMVADAATPDLDWATDCTRPLTTRAAVNVALSMTQAVST